MSYSLEKHMAAPGGTRVLIIEDEPFQALMLQTLLELRLSAIVDVAESCAAARDMLGRGDYDVITVDNQLPDGRGLDLLKEIKELQVSAPVIMVTGQGDENLAVESFRLGASGYVVKDKRLPALIRSIGSYPRSRSVMRSASSGSSVCSLRAQSTP
jgi:DNA-binding NtrC family response regulator